MVVLRNGGRWESKLHLHRCRGKLGDVGGSRSVFVHNVDKGHHAAVFVEQNCLRKGKGGGKNAIGEIEKLFSLYTVPLRARWSEQTISTPPASIYILSSYWHYMYFFGES